MNDGISPDLVSLSYIAVDDVAAIVQELGKGSLLAKMDIEAAYRLIPVHPHDRVLQGMEWDGKIYVDPVYLLGCGRLRRFLMQWQMACVGAFARLVSSSYCIT